MGPSSRLSIQKYRLMSEIRLQCSIPKTERGGERLWGETVEKVAKFGTTSKVVETVVTYSLRSIYA
jgi:hypothetical protein